VDTPHVQLIIDENPVPPPLQTALNRLNARVSVRSLSKALDQGVSPSADVCVILPNAQRSADVLDRILNHASDRACGTLILPSSECIKPDIDLLSGSRYAAPETANEFISMNADELTGRIKALCEIRHPLKKMRDELVRLRERDAKLTSGVQEINAQLQLASQVQHDLLPDSSVICDPLSIHTLFLPADHISGDIYDISRLDEDRYGFSIADATGHGLPAALLTIMIKNSFKGKEIVNGYYRIIDPDELLRRLNRDLLDTNLTQCQFITALHAIFDRRQNQICWARGGIPYPILIRPGETPRQMLSKGGLIGAFENNAFEIATHDFESGDTLLFFTDGLEALLMGKEVNYGTESILHSPWISQLSIDGPEAALAEIKERASHIPDEDWPKDDITVIILKMN